MPQSLFRQVCRGKTSDSKGEWKSAHHESKENKPKTKRWKACHPKTQEINET